MVRLLEKLLVTVELAPITVLSPIVTLPIILEPGPIHTWFPIFGEVGVVPIFLLMVVIG